MVKECSLKLHDNANGTTIINSIKICGAVSIPYQNNNGNKTFVTFITVSYSCPLCYRKYYSNMLSLSLNIKYINNTFISFL